MALYDDAIWPLLEQAARPGSLRIRRASDVEPGPEGTGWTVWIRPWIPGGGVWLGPGGVGDRTPWPTRGAALAAEAAALRWPGLLRGERPRATDSP